MGQQKNSFENLEEKTANFKDEIRLIIEKEREDQKTAHFKELNPEELLPEDMEIWGKIKDGSIMREGMEEYKNNIIDKTTGGVKIGISQSRKEFFAFVANKAGIIFLKEQVEERKKLKQ